MRRWHRGVVSSLAVCLALAMVGAPAVAGMPKLIGQIDLKSSAHQSPESRSLPGDLFRFKVVQPGGQGDLYVSVHAERQNRNWRWVPIAVGDRRFEAKYASPKYSGVRDFVRFDGVPEEQIRDVRLFIPYAAMAVTRGDEFDRRYVVRLWNHTNDQIASLELGSQRVATGTRGGRRVIEVITMVATGPPTGGRKPASHAQRGIVSRGTRFSFDAETGAEIME